MSEAVKIRPARWEDIPRVLKLERGIEGAPHWAEREYAAMLESSEDGGIRRRLIVAEQGGLVIGFAVGKVAALTMAEIESVAVAVDARRLGVGRTLCVALLAWFRDAGADSIELEVRAGNEGAITLYRRLGFAATGRRTMYYREPSEDALLMSMALAEK